jgi:uncharacterized protein YlxP (DUF503 family)
MIVGTLRIRFLVRQSQSLKDKRQVVKSIKDRLRNAFNVSVAEVEAEDHRQLAVLGLAMVGNEVQYVKSCLEKIVALVRGHPVAEFLDHEIEV